MYQVPRRGIRRAFEEVGDDRDPRAGSVLRTKRARRGRAISDAERSVAVVRSRYCLDADRAVPRRVEEHRRLKMFDTGGAFQDVLIGWGESWVQGDTAQNAYKRILGDWRDTAIRNALARPPPDGLPRCQTKGKAGP